MPPSYVPVILSRRPELRALRELSAAARHEVLPLLVVAPPPWDFVGDAPLVSASDHLAAMPDLLATAWRGVAFVDLCHLDDKVSMNDGTAGITWLALECQLRGLTVVPVLDASAPDHVLPDVAEVASWGHRGLALRLRRHEWPSTIGPLALQRLLDGAGVGLEQCDLILDAEDRLHRDPVLVADLVRYELATLPDADRWRSIVVIGTSAPGLGGTSQRRGPRHEWTLYRDLVLAGDLPRLPVYGDYVVSHPDPAVDLLGGMGQLVLRYTTDDAWVSVRAASRRWPTERTEPEARAGGGGPSIPPDLATPAMALRVRSDRGFRAGHCEFDRVIDDMVASRHGLVASAALQRMATLHHLELVVEQLAQLRAPSGAAAMIVSRTAPRA